MATVAATAAMLYYGSPANAESLQEAVSKAVQTNPNVEQAKRNREAQRYELQQARDLYLPSLDLSAAGGPEWSDTRTIDATWMPRYELGLTLSELLWDGWGRENRIEARASRLDAAAFRVFERSEATALNAIEAYLDVIRNQELVALAEENVGNHDEYLGNVRERVRGGRSGVGDEQQARSRLSAAQDALYQQTQQLEDAKAAFIQVVGEEAAELETPTFDETVLPPSHDAAVHRAVTKSPTVHAASAELDETVQNFEQAKSEYFPRFTAEVAKTNNRNIDGVRGQNSDFRAMVRMNWNLFRGGIDNHRRMELAERVGEQRAVVMTLERDVAQQTSNSWNARDVAMKRVGALNDQVVANSQVLSTYRQEFDIGQRPLLDLLDAQNELFTSRSQLKSAEFVALFASYRLLAAMGELTGTLNVTLPAEAVADARQDAGVKPDYVPGQAMSN